MVNDLDAKKVCSSCELRLGLSHVLIDILSLSHTHTHTHPGNFGTPSHTPTYDRIYIASIKMLTSLDKPNPLTTYIENDGVRINPYTN